VQGEETRIESNRPVLTRYEDDHLARVALPIGGIGTGTISLGGRGDLRDWEVVNRPAKGFAPSPAFFALWTRPEGGEPVTRALEGPLDPALFEGAHGSQTANHGLPRFRECVFEAAYPFGQVLLSDPEVPLNARLEAFNPLIPADADRSGIPVAALRFVLTNRTDVPVEASVCGSIRNFIGADGSGGEPSGNRNEYRESGGISGVFMRSDGVDPGSELWGTMALTTTGPGGVTCRTAWPELSWGGSLLDFWDDFSADGRIEERSGDAPVASLAASLEVPPGGEESVTFLISWHFPNRMAWSCGSGEVRGYSRERIGNHYATLYTDAWDVAEKTARELSNLEEDTLRFVESFRRSDLPEAVKEAALYNLSTLRTQTCFRDESGRLYGWEGCSDAEGCCPGSCTHVWNYEQATAFLFGDLARSMREEEFLLATRDDGHMSFRVGLPAGRETEWGLAAADGQMGCIMKLYRDWQLSGDERLLRRLWPKAKKALEFCWIQGGWDADRDGVMEGCQHNTMDVEYYGPNPQMGTWYLGALRVAEEMACHLGEEEFAGECRDLFERGSRWLDENLFNGEYYEHQVRPLRASEIASGLRHESMGARDLEEPELQLGPGCLVDQLVGQYMAHVCGLGYLLDPENVRSTLRAILRHNRRRGFFGHFNPMRSFALGDETALLMASYPRGGRPERPFPYHDEVMTGFEYTAAVHMLYEDMSEEGLECISDIRGRYDGRRRNPFDEAECGHHYARAMASWGAVLALTGFRYGGVEQEMRFAAGFSRTFWSNGYAWGGSRQRPAADGIEVELEVMGGELPLRRLVLEGVGAVEVDEEIRAGEARRFLIGRGEGRKHG
jgi:non-lysosomal glucosylceramidase